MKARSTTSAALVAVTLAACAGCSGGGSGSSGKSKASAVKKMTVTGQLKVGALSMDLSSITDTSVPCKGGDDFADVAAGAQVVLSDNTGATVGLGSLENDPYDGDRPAGCYFHFTVANVPAGKGFYGVKIAGHAMPQVAESQLKSKLSLKLGRGA